MSSKPHLTTRRGFVVSLGFGGVSLYGLWAAYGAAPGPLTLLGLGHGGAEVAAHAGGHEPHRPTGDSPSPEEFRRLTRDFIERYRLADGSVHPRPPTDHPEHAAGDHDGHAGLHGLPRGAAHAAGDHTDDAHAEGHGDGMAGEDGTAAAHAHADGEPVDVYLLAEKWFYEPSLLRLDAGVPYRFRMMATDVAHGASIQLGRGGRMIRLRPGRVVEQVITFRRPGSYLVYCTIYCGQAHDWMQGRIVVV